MATPIEIESSAVDSQPMELYLFQQLEKKWPWTTADIDILSDGDYYQSQAIVRSDLNISGARSEDILELEVSPDNEIVQLFTRGVPEHSISVTMFRVQRQHVTSPFSGSVYRTLLDPANKLTMWHGRVRAVQWTRESATITCDLFGTSSARHAPRKVYSKMCTNMLYDEGCKIAKEDPRWRVEGQVTLAEGLQVHMLEAGTRPNGFFSGGILVRNGRDHRMVYGHISNTLYLLIPFVGLEAGEVLELYAGCDRFILTCKTRFDNVLNFGGFPLIPPINPFESGITS